MRKEFRIRNYQVPCFLRQILACSCPLGGRASPPRPRPSSGRAGCLRAALSGHTGRLSAPCGPRPRGGPLSSYPLKTILFHPCVAVSRYAYCTLHRLQHRETQRPEAQFLVPVCGEIKLGYVKGLSFWSARLHRLAGRYSRLYPPLRDYEFGYRGTLVLVES
jgi:hypothetical protein